MSLCTWTFNYHPILPLWVITEHWVELPEAYGKFPLGIYFINTYGNGWGFPGDSDGKDHACNAGDLGLSPGSGRSPGEGNGNPLQYCLENSTDRGAWQASRWRVRAGHWVTNSLTLAWWCIYVNAALFNSPHPSFPHRVHKFVFYVCVFTVALQIGSLVPFFWIPCICINIWYLFSSFQLTSLFLTESLLINMFRNLSRL